MGRSGEVERPEVQTAIAAFASYLLGVDTLAHAAAPIEIPSAS